MKVHFSTRFSGALGALLLTATACPAAAHHSAAVFDLTKHISMSGTVEKWLWANPHSWLYIRVMKPDGTQEIWGLEAGSTTMLQRSGWSAHDMKPGDKVTVDAHPSVNGSHNAILSRVKLATGRILTADGPPPGGATPPPLPR